MEIFVSDIPEEGLPVAGSLSALFFDLPTDDSIRILDGVEFDVTLYRFEDVVVLSGKVSGSFELQCVTCLEYFPYEADFPKWQSEVDIEEGEVKFDPREGLRDEVLLSLPVTPHCDEMLENHECPKVELVEKFEQGASLPDYEPGAGDLVWGVLDELDKKE